MSPKIIAVGTCVAASIAAIGLLQKKSNGQDIQEQFATEMKLYQQEFDAGNPGPAEQHLIRAMQLRDSADPQRAKQRDALTVTAVLTKDLKQQEMLLREIIALDPEYPESQMNLATCLQKQGKLNAAKDIYRAVAQNSQFPVTARVASKSLAYLSR